MAHTTVESSQRQRAARSGGPHFIVITPVSCGVDLNIVQEGIPPMIPAEMCYLGWQESLKLLGQLVEPEIPQ